MADGGSSGKPYPDVKHKSRWAIGARRHDQISAEQRDALKAVSRGYSKRNGLDTARGMVLAIGIGVCLWLVIGLGVVLIFY